MNECFSHELIVVLMNELLLYIHLFCCCYRNTLFNLQEISSLQETVSEQRRQIGKLKEKLDVLEGKKRFDPKRAFGGKENTLKPDNQTEH